MIDKFLYKNHNGEIIEFGKDWYFANKNDLRDYSWNFDSKRRSISNFKKASGSRSLQISILGKDKAETTERKNKFFEVVEKDVIAEEPGRFYIGNYYLECYVTRSKKKDYTKHSFLIIDIDISTTTDKWIKDTVFEFAPEGGTDTDGKEYPYDFNYDYSAVSGSNGKIINTHFDKCAFTMKISGYAINPALTIGGHVYRVEETVQANEILTIDSRDKSIYLTRNTGLVVNCFDKRDRDSYIFEPIPSGESNIYWNGNYNVEVTLHEERSEPEWI